MSLDQIDWDHVSPDYKFLARDKGGNAYLYTKEPVVQGSTWVNGEIILQADVFASFVAGTVDWQDSLIKRPEVG